MRPAERLCQVTAGGAANREAGMPRIAGEREEGVQAVVWALRVIEHLAAEQRPVGVTALAQALGTTKSRIFRHLQTLVQQHYLIQDPETGRYAIGPRFITLG